MIYNYFREKYRNITKIERKMNGFTLEKNIQF